MKPREFAKMMNGEVEERAAEIAKELFAEGDLPCGSAAHVFALGHTAGFMEAIYGLTVVAEATEEAVKIGVRRNVRKALHELSEMKKARDGLGEA